MCCRFIFKLSMYLIVVHKWDTYKDTKKTVFDVKHIYLFFKVGECSDLVTETGNELLVYIMV